MESERKEAWRTIVLFVVLVFAITAPFHYALVNLYPSRTYVGAIMWCPAIAAFVTLKIRKRPLSSLNWNWGSWKYIKLSYFIPAIYGLVTYLLIWLFGLGEIADKDVIKNWGEELGLIGIGTLNTTVLLAIALVLVGTIEVIRAAATTLGEEIGWRGFFIYELRKVTSFTGVSIISGIIWALWHWPIIVFYGGNVLLEMSTFLVVIVSMSFIMTYITFKAQSLWPAVIFHAVSNVYIQKILPELTIANESADHWHGEYGIMFALVTFIFGIYYWRRGLREGL
jgi:membrane protease YdiL (CAAX protease family)